jgi:hypothetical protein
VKNSIISGLALALLVCWYSYSADGQEAKTVTPAPIPATKKITTPAVKVTAPAPATAPALKTPAWAEEKAVAIAKTPAAAPATPAVPAVKKEAEATDFVVPVEPATTDEAVTLARKAFSFAVARNWLALSACIILIIMFALKTIKIGGQTIFEKFGKRWAYIISAVLSIVGALVANLAGNVSWNTVWIVLASGPVTGALSDLWKRGIMAQEPTTPIVAVKSATANGSVVTK